MANWSKKLSGEAAREVASQLFWSYWPLWGGPIVSGVLFFLNGYPSGVIFMAAIGAFAIVALAMNNFSQWRAAQSAFGKVDFLAPAMGVMNDGDPPRLRGIKMGVAVRSTAIFPMEVRIDDLETQIGDRVPGTGFQPNSVTIAQGIAAQFNGAMIDMTGLERANCVLYGHISASITYGRPGYVKYPANITWYMAFKFDKDGNFVGAEPSLTNLTPVSPAVSPLRLSPPGTQ